MINSLDELEYEGGYPTVETIQKLYDHSMCSAPRRPISILCPRCRCRLCWMHTSVTFDVSGDVIEDSEAEMRSIMARQ